MKYAVRKGIHPTIVQVILIAVTLTVTIVAISWILGVWHVEQEQFSVVPMLYMRSDAGGAGTTQPVLELHIRNEGSKAAKIIRIEVRTDNGYWFNNSVIIVPGGSTIDVVIDRWSWVGEGEPPVLVPGGKYRIVIYTEQWGQIFYDVTVSS